MLEHAQDWRKRAMACLVAVAVLSTVVAPVVAEIQWPTSIQSFERHNPVFTQVVEPGTAVEELELPETLRAVIDLDESWNTEQFVQAQPEADESDGYTHYDYYYYGYVAPKQVEQLYESGELAIYTIYYADQDDPTTVGEEAYRVYGSLGGSEYSWFACDKEGNITGVVLDVPVTWKNQGYDPDQEGVYTFTAKPQGFACAAPQPVATITVQCALEDGEDADHEHDHDALPSTQPDAEGTEQGDEALTCTCGAQPDENGVITHAQDCPAYTEPLHCTCEEGEDVFSAHHAQDCPYYVEEELLCTCPLQTNEVSDQHDPTCPQYVRLATDCHCGPNGEAIDADNFPWAHQEDCIHFSPIECMCREMVPTVIESLSEDGTETGEHTELIPGDYSHVHDPSNIDCPLYGQDTVRIKKLATGEESVMAKADAERIVTSQQAMETAGVQKLNLDSTQADNSTEKALYPALGEIEIIEGTEQSGANSGVSTLSLNGGGANDVAQDNFMRTNTPTSGNPAGSGEYDTGVPGTWVDYINTMWMNKAFNEFAWTTDAQTGAYNGWKWSGATATGTSGTVTSSQYRIPSKSSGRWTVYSGEQIRYAIMNADEGDVIYLGGSINMNGKNYNWNVISLGNKTSLRMNGANYSIYNLGILGDTTRGAFVADYFRLNVQNISFVSVKDVSSKTDVGLFIRRHVAQDAVASTKPGYQMVNVTVTNSMFYTSNTASYASPFGQIHFAAYTDRYPDTAVIQKCASIGNWVYGRDHVAGFTTAASYGKISNCFVIDTKVFGKGGHSGGFISCGANDVTITNCFASIEQYGTTACGAFLGLGTGTITSCFATGKIEGYRGISGFAAMIDNGYFDPAVNPSILQGYEIKQCYTTCLTGLRSESSNQGGFLSLSTTSAANPPYPEYVKATDCYAAGEVGSYSVNMDSPGSIGGFAAQKNMHMTTTLSHCYYDKQTTAMREWITGDSKTLSGVTGVLTTDTQDSSGATIHGLVGQPGSAGEQGFTGFSDNSQWVYHDQHYPQLAVFANATASGWGDTDTANLVKAYSAASTATVFLNTWDKGYDWDETGVRTQSEVSYDRTNAAGVTHKGDVTTYDTVREITTDFTVSYSAEHQSKWSELIAGGAKVNADGQIRNDTVDIDNQGHGTVTHPGMNWYQVEATVSGQTGYRPIRLIAFMTVDAGADKTVYSGVTYDHRDDVSLHMINTLVDNLVVGLDDDKVWATSKKQGYPNSKKFYNVATTATQFSASQNALLRTEIWLAEQEEDGSYVPDASQRYYDEASGIYLTPGTSVKVTGPGTGQGTTLDEQKWNGEIPLYPDTSTQRKYIVSYYWVLEDGRYNEDYKIITIEPGEYDLTVQVLNLEDNTSNTTLVYPAAGADKDGALGYTIPAATAGSAQAQDIRYTTNSAAAWKLVDADSRVEKLQVQFFANDTAKTSMGSATVEGEVVDGTTITIPITYYYTTQESGREVTKEQVVNVTYTVVERKDSKGKGTGEFYLRFNKLYNTPDWEVPTAIAGTNDSTGFPSGTLAYVNDMQFNTEVTIWVDSGMDFSFIKTDQDGNAFQAGEAEFQLYSCGHVHDASCGGLTDPEQCNHQHDELATQDSCWVTEGDTVMTAQTDATGQVLFEKLASGEYMLAETRTKDGMQLPIGQWLITVDVVQKTIDIKAKGEMPPAFKVETVNGETVLKLPNYPIWTTPSSGGYGAILFTVVGIVLMGGAICALILTGKRSRKE